MKTVTRCRIPSLLGIVAAVILSFVALPRANSQGRLVAWGDDSSGRVSGAPAGTFVKVAVGLDLTGPGHCVAIRTNGTLSSWGDDTYGQVSSTPTGGPFTDVAAGSTFSVAVRADGSLVSWGGAPGPLPDGQFTAVACGQYHGVALRTDGTLAAWGYDTFGVPLDPPSGTFVAIAAAGSHGVAIRTDGTLAAWGFTTWGDDMGPGPAGTYTAISSCWARSAAVRSDGVIVTWGEVNGDTGAHSISLNDPPGTYSRVAIGDVSTVYSQVYTVGIRLDGTLAASGNLAGLGNAVPAGTYTSVAAGEGFCVAIATPDPTSYTVSPLFDQSKSHRAGSTVPIKLRVLDESGANLSSSTLKIHAVSVSLVSGAAPGPLEESGSANPDYDFRYDSGLGGYVFNLSLKGYFTGTYNLNFVIGDDPTRYSVQFQVK